MTDGDGESPARDRRLDRARVALVGVLVLLTPAVAIVVVYAVARATQAASLAELTPLQLVELYLLELGVFAVFAYLLYRVTLRGVRRVSVDANADERPDGGGPSGVRERDTAATNGTGPPGAE